MDHKKIQTIFLLPLLLPTLFLILQAPFAGIPIMLILKLARCFAAIFAIQAAVALPSILLGNELFYDLAGAVSFLVVVIGISLREGSEADWRQRVMSGAVALWAGRCKFLSFFAIDFWGRGCVVL